MLLSNIKKQNIKQINLFIIDFNDKFVFDAFDNLKHNCSYRRT